MPVATPEGMGNGRRRPMQAQANAWPSYKHEPNEDFPAAAKCREIACDNHKVQQISVKAEDITPWSWRHRLF